MVRKGISNLVSATLIMAVTVSLAGLFSSWAPGIVNSVTDGVDNQTDQRLNCNKGDVEIVSAKYYSGQNTTAVIRNTGTIDLNKLNIEAWQNDLPMNQTQISIGPGNYSADNISTTSKPTSIRAYSQSCSDVTDVFEDIQ